MSQSLFEELEKIFHPRSMASVGASTSMPNMGTSFLMGYERQGFSGRLYAINPTKKLDDFETYPSVLDVPGPIDFVTICVPARLVPQIMKQCVEKGVRCVNVFSSGFRESGTIEGKALEDEVVGIAKAGGVRVIGPNCMGLYCPESGLSIRADMPLIMDGRIGLVSQSGGVSISLAMAASEKGLGLSKVVSYGNESDLGAPEFLHYMARDPKTEVICLYIEGTRRPDDLKAAIKDATGKKPLIILKGGLTEAGSRAVASHTGALTGASELWGAIARQAGAFMTEDTDEMIDLATLFVLSRPPAGKRIGLLTISGGFGVFATDQVIKAGFEMPKLSPGTQAGLREFIDAPGTSRQNPVDMASKFFQPQYYTRMFQVFDNDPGIDAYVLVCAMEYLTLLGDQAEQMSSGLVAALIDGLGQMKKPIYVAFLHSVRDDIRGKHVRAFTDAGYPVFPTVKRCLLALQRALKKTSAS